MLSLVLAQLVGCGAPTPVLPPPPPAPAHTSELLKLDFVRIEPGSFTMGSPQDQPGRFPDEVQHPARVDQAFWLSTTEVTQGQWRALTGQNPSKFQQCGEQCPIENITWVQAIRFCNALSAREDLTPVYKVQGSEVTWNRQANGYRLPTEVEWEWAVRAEQNTLYSGSNDVDAVSWHYENAGQTPHPVALKAPNAWGLYDLSGNVSEWVFDVYAPYIATPDAPKDPENRSFRTYRGGSAGGQARNSRVAYRNGRLVTTRYDDHGFRIARNVPAVGIPGADALP